MIAPRKSVLPKNFVIVKFLGNKGEELGKTCIRKIKRYAMFCSLKDKIPTHQKPNVIYAIKFPGCDKNYVGKTERCVITT